MKRTAAWAIQALRKRQPTLRDLARELGVNPGYLSAVLRGRRRASNKLIQTLNAALVENRLRGGLELNPVSVLPCNRCGKAKTAKRCPHCARPRILNDLPVAARPAAMLAWQLRNREQL